MKIEIPVREFLPALEAISKAASTEAAVPQINGVQVEPYNDKARTYGVAAEELQSVLDGRKRPSMKLVAGIVDATGWQIATVANLTFKQIPRTQQAA